MAREFRRPPRRAPLVSRILGATGVPIVFLHANTGTSATWEPQLNYFSSAGFRVIAIDRRGLGRERRCRRLAPSRGASA